jgi:hypothetical protein
MLDWRPLSQPANSPGAPLQNKIRGFVAPLTPKIEAAIPRLITTGVYKNLQPR